MKDLSLLIDNMIKLSAKVIFITFVIICRCILIPSSLSAQTVDNEVVDYEISNEKLAIALKRLADKAEFNFAYDAADTIFNEIVSYSTDRKAVTDIISDLIKEFPLDFKIIDNQIVIFRTESLTESVVEQTNDTIVMNEEDKATDEVDIPINVTYIKKDNNVLYVSDTVIIRDTIYKYETDTLIRPDTSYVNLGYDSISDEKIQFDYFSRNPLKKNGWATEIFISPILSDFSLVESDKEMDIRNFSLGIEISKVISNLSISGVAKLTHFSEKFNHSYVIQEGGYYIVDTVDIYYTINQLDTTYYFVTDSAWKPVDSKEYNYNIDNRIGLMDFGLSLSYDFYNSRNFKMYITTGAQLGILIYKHGIAISDTTNPEGINFTDLKFRKRNISALGGIGMKFKVNNSVALNSQFYYLHYFDNIVYDYPKETHLQGIGVKVGLSYYF